MKSVIRLWVGMVALMWLSACSGGGDIADGGEPPQPDYTLSLSLQDNAGNTIAEVSKAVPGILLAKLLKNGVPVVQQRLVFALDGQGILAVDSDVTDAAGIAETGVFAGSQKGAGRLSVSASIDGQSVEQTLDFATLGDDDDGGTTPIDEYKLTLMVRNSNGEEHRHITFQQPGELVANLSRNEVPVSFERIAFSLDGQGYINPTAGTALTNQQGEAVVTVLTGNTAGTAKLTAQFTLEQETLTQTFNVQVAGDAPGGEGEANQLAIALHSSQTGAVTSTVSAADPGLITVQLTDKDNQAIAGRVVSFTSTLGSFLPVQATALTDTLGRTQITLTAGSIEGAAEVTVAYGETRATVGFVTAGDDIDPVEASPQIQFNIYDCSSAPTFDKALKNFDVCRVTTNITNDKPGIIGATITRAGSVQPLPQVLVTAATTIGALAPSSGTAITDGQGRAILDLYANGDVGAGEVSLKVQDTVSVKAFDIGREDITLEVITSVGNGELPAGGSAVVEVTVKNPDGSLATGQPTTLEFTSECMTAGTAIIDTPVVTNAGKGFATYRAQGCRGNDTINVSAVSGSSTVSAAVGIRVADVTVGAIQYLSAVPVQLALRGTSGIDGAGSRQETSVVSFKLLDASGQAAPQEKVCFELSTDVGGMVLSPKPVAQDYLDCANLPNPGDAEYPADINLPNKYAVAYTDGKGEVRVTVNAGSVATPVKVFAQWSGSNGQGHDNIISNSSEQLVVSTGIADANSFSVAASVLNPEAWNIDGEEVIFTVRAADHFNNLVPAGTRVSFVAEGGAVDASCETGLKASDLPNGRCSVTWVSQGERPFKDVVPTCPTGFNGSTAPPCIGTSLSAYLDGSASTLPEPRPGRATITAFAIGEESFVDLNGNGLYDQTDIFELGKHDLPEAFFDHNEDGNYRVNGTGGSPGEVNEEFVDFNRNGLYDAGDGLYTGLLCAAGSEAGCSSTGADLAGAQLNVFANIPVVMAGSQPKMALASISGNNIAPASTIDLTSNASVTVYLFISDHNNNVPPFGTTISVETDNGVLSSGNTAPIIIGSSSGNKPLMYSYTLNREATPNGLTSGAFVITAKTPQGEPVSVSLQVIDNG